MVTRTTLTLLALTLAAPVSAETVHRQHPYGPAFRGAAYGSPAYGGYDGFGGEFVRGSYIGAPLTRVPRPSEIVPSPWSYGTYGVPTVSGIAAPPAAAPTLTVINAAVPHGRNRVRSLEEGQTAGARVITVQVPRR